MALNGLNHITLAVGNLDRSFGFYVDTLEFKPRAKWSQGAYLSLNGFWLCLSVDEVSPSADYTHIAFSVDQNALKLCSENLAQAGAHIWKNNNSEGDSIYFLDPDGHKLELHCGDLATRLASLKLAPYDGLQLFD